ncbi:hypothetical protein GP486_003502 [Trichoglossum hirsutum]|uniref:Uncharacterized protein n=1 Tax=Trichoglossum hirsutum TaxID=265104 RepID=A0A9P8LD09_9PEZI|nr:hypothetical protein GP486_003502 [Trichoglossum hirsutum]
MTSRNDKLPVPKRRKMLSAPPNTSKYQRVLNMLSELSFANIIQPETKLQHKQYLQTFLEGLRPGHGLLDNEQEEKNLNNQIKLQDTVYKEQEKKEEIEELKLEQELKQNKSEIPGDLKYLADFVEVDGQYVPIWDYLEYS